jgi:pimeloyl-ACP methyl ester carboxylesterase
MLFSRVFFRLRRFLPMPTLLAAGHRLAYEWIEVGGEGRPVLVFLHEGLGSIRQWRDVPERVARASGCNTLVYDRYGYGQSDVLAEPRRGVRFMHEEALEALPQVLAALDIEAPILVGHSDGASIALIHAGAGHPVRGLALMAPHVFVEPICTESIVEARTQFETTDLAQRLGRHHRDARKTFYLWADVWLDPEFPGWNIEAYLPGVACPVLVIQGHDDRYGTMAQLDAIAGQVRGPCELLKLEACGHSPFRDQPSAVQDAIARFIDALCVAGGQPRRRTSDAA